MTKKTASLVNDFIKDGSNINYISVYGYLWNTVRLSDYSPKTNG